VPAVLAYSRLDRDRAARSMNAANENRRVVLGQQDPVATRELEIERSIVALEREFGALGVHERIVVARELDALVHRVGHTFGDNDW
jgi:hypothetical protein